MPLLGQKNVKSTKTKLILGPKVNMISSFPNFLELLLLAPVLIQKSINIKNGQLNFLDGGVGGVTLKINIKFKEQSGPFKGSG